MLQYSQRTVAALSDERAMSARRCCVPLTGVRAEMRLEVRTLRVDLLAAAVRTAVDAPLAVGASVASARRLRRAAVVRAVPDGGSGGGGGGGSRREERRRRRRHHRAGERHRRHRDRHGRHA